MTPPYACLIIPLAFVILAFLWYALVMSRATPGYEDDEGFHYAEKPTDDTP